MKTKRVISERMRKTRENKKQLRKVLTKTFLEKLAQFLATDTCMTSIQAHPRALPKLRWLS